ncbi:Transcriptional regulator, AraC family [Altererythrobacter epoxidivorans]|uniref:Transcriptional regulator, AraC family n=2 Tax=Altererythrobacter epoxidivorans TaxID=361183 RepID=A0A0M5KZ25_9SPHN|nr:Transcriptional regulator, AraC family [Altererythrobacter epoxidivorans]
MHAGGELEEGKPIALTPPALFEIDYIAPPTALSDYITTLYHFRCDEPHIRDIQPAAIGHLTLFPRGVGEMQFANGHADPSHETNLLTPFTVAAPFEVDGPFHSIGAVFSPLGWVALTGLDASEHCNHLYRASDWLGPEIEQMGSELCRDYRDGKASGPDLAHALCDYIAASVKPVPARHAELIKKTVAWVSSSLNPDVGELMQDANYSARQVQRLVERFFGLPPRALARKYRALRAAMLLSLPMMSDEVEAELAEAFYDQSHLIREIRLFVGRTPARLSDDASPFLSEMLAPRNLREIKLPEFGEDE